MGGVLRVEHDARKEKTKRNSFVNAFINSSVCTNMHLSLKQVGCMSLSSRLFPEHAK